MKFFHIAFQVRISVSLWGVTKSPITFLILRNMGARGSVVVKALCCKQEGRGFKSRRSGLLIDLILQAALALRSTQPLTEMSTRNL
jgi:hypothetical protein